MNIPKKAVALAAGFATALAIAAGGSSSAQNPSAAGTQTLVIDEASIDWIERSNVAALREGVIERMELDIGMPVAAGKPIGYLHSELAALGVKKAQIASNSVGPKAKAQAQKELAAAVVAINQRLASRGKNLVSYEEMQKAEAELKVAQAMVVEADEKYQLDKAELALAERAFDEHTIKAPFEGIVIERMKHPGESVRANEAVVRLGNLSRLRAYFYVPLDYSYRVKEGQIIEFRPKLGDRNAAPNPIEQKRFRGKITFVDPQLQPVVETARRVYAELDNKDLELSPGLKGTATIYLDSTPVPPPGAGPTARTESVGVGR
jgi:RND family efflux transporter MFP subunit